MASNRPTVWFRKRDTMMMTGVTQAVVGGGDIITAEMMTVAGGGFATGGIETTTDGTSHVIMTATRVIATAGAGAGIDCLTQEPACCNAQRKDYV